MANSASGLQTLPPLHRVLVVGSGGREHALGWALSRCPGIEAVWVSPGNGGIPDQALETAGGYSRLAIAEGDHEGLLNHCQNASVDLVVVGPEAPLAAGLADHLRDAGIAVFGPGADGAQLEASKAWAKQLMQTASIPTAGHWSISSIAEGLAVLEQLQRPLVVKADGLAAGKGVTVATSIEETAHAIQEAFGGRFGSAGERVVLEECLQGPEVSVFALCDGERMVILPPAQDHKRLLDGDQGPNTGGMGAYAPAPLLDPDGLEQVRQLVLEPTLKALRERGISYRGVIYAGLMLTNSGPQVIEYNCRFGDPECQTLMPLMGPELAQVLQACALGRLDLAPTLTIRPDCSVCVVAAAAGYPDAPRKGDAIHIDLQPDDRHQLFHAGTRRDPQGTLLSSGGRVLTMTAQGADFDQAFTSAYQALEQVRFAGMHYRRDIGHQVRRP
ncbi:MAG: phosphoribosylamine--glycine ligase [Synechococcus sp.]